MRSSVFWSLVRKDVYLMRGFMIAMVVVGLLSLVLMALGKVGFAVGGILFLTANVAGAIFIALTILFGERKDRSRTFALSLPISGYQYDMAKLLAGYLSFGIPWLVLTAAAIGMFLLPPREHLGMVVYALVLQGFVLALFSVTLSAMFVITSEAMTGMVILGTNICFSLFMVTLNQPETAGPLRGIADRVDDIRTADGRRRGAGHRARARLRRVRHFPQAGLHLKSQGVSHETHGKRPLLAVAIACSRALCRLSQQHRRRIRSAGPTRSPAASVMATNMQGAAQGTPLVRSHAQARRLHARADEEHRGRINGHQHARVVRDHERHPDPPAGHLHRREAGRPGLHRLQGGRASGPARREHQEREARVSRGDRGHRHRPPALFHRAPSRRADPGHRKGPRPENRLAGRQALGAGSRHAEGLRRRLRGARPQDRLRHGLSAGRRPASRLRKERLDLSLLHRALQRLQRGRAASRSGRCR